MTNVGVVELFREHVTSKTTDDYYGIHHTRFMHTLERCGETLSQARRVLELGGHSYIGRFARDFLQAAVTEYTDDLRYPFKLPDREFDLVLALEVLEHVKDSPLRDTSMHWISHFNFSGLENLFAETFRVLMPGGRFIMTTPNATSVDVLLKVLSGHHPHLFEPHVRELAPADVFRLTSNCGFELVKFDTFFSWTVASEDFRRRALQFIKAAGFSVEHRGDNAYFELRKPL